MRAASNSCCSSSSSSSSGGLARVKCARASRVRQVATRVINSEGESGGAKFMLQNGMVDYYEVGVTSGRGRGKPLPRAHAA
jgi:hypothetical protein